MKDLTPFSPNLNRVIAYQMGAPNSGKIVEVVLLATGKSAGPGYILRFAGFSQEEIDLALQQSRLMGQ